MEHYSEADREENEREDSEIEEETETAEQPDELEEFEVIPLKRAFKNSLYSERLAPISKQSDLARFHNFLSKSIGNELKKALAVHRGIKSWVKVEAVYSKESEQKTINAVLNTHAAVIFN